MTTETEFFLTLRDETTVWCAEHDAPVDTWQPAPPFQTRQEAEQFIASAREWFASPTSPGHCLFRHPEPVAR